MSAERFEELYERYVDGTLDPAGRAEFLAMLEDPAHRARFVELAVYEAALGEELTLAEPALLPQEEKKASSRKNPAVGRRSTGRIPVVRARRTPSRPPVAGWQIGIGVAAAVLVGIIVFFATASRGGEPARRPAPPVAEQTPAPRPQEVDPIVPPKQVVKAVRAPLDPPPPPIETPRESRTPLPLVVPSVKSEPTVAPKGSMPVEKPRPEPEAPRESVAFIAQIERSSDPAETGKGIVSGQRLSTGAGRYLSVKFLDGTRLELGGDTIVGRVAEIASGKWVQVERGLVSVDAAKQAAGKTLVVASPFAEATVLGTEFTVWTTGSFSRLDVKEGRVKFARPGGATSLVVGAGYFAIAGQGYELAAKPGVSMWKAPAAGLILWLRADGMTNAAQWTDASPMGNHGAQPVAGSQPSLIPNAAGARAALRFDGKDDFYALPDGFSDFRAGLSAFVVTRPAPGGAWSRFLDLDAGPACDNIVFGRRDAPDKLGFWVYANDQTRGKVEAPGAVVADQVQSLGVVLAQSGRATLFRNGAPVAAGQTSVPTGVVRKPNGIGKSSSGDPYFKGDFFEILLYNRAIGDAERPYIDAYLNSKYFDPNAPPPMNRPSER